MTAHSSINNLSQHSPVTSCDGGDNSPLSCRSGLPWAQVVRGEPEAIAISAVPRSPWSSPITATEQSASPENSAAETRLGSSHTDNGNVDRPKKPAWNKSLNGVVEVGAVMGGAVAWPALSESTRPSVRSLSESSKPMSDKSAAIFQGPLLSHSPHKQANTSANTWVNPNVKTNHSMPAQQRSMKHRGGGGTGGGSAHSGFNRPPPPPPAPPPPIPPPFPVFEPYGGFVPVMLDPSVRGLHYKGNNWESRPMGGAGSHLHSGNNRSSQRNSPRKSNFGPRPRGEGSYHRTNNHGRPDHQVAPPRREFLRPAPPGSAPFITPPPMSSFGNQMGFDVASPFSYVPTLPSDSFRGVPFVAPAPPPPMYLPVWDPLPSLLVNQIDYYFSDANLVKDNFLRSKMDDEGWVDITLIASFPRVQSLTKNIQFILDSLRASTVVEVQGNKVRRRNEWCKWITTVDRVYTDSGSQSPIGSLNNIVATSFQNISLDEVTTNKNSIMGVVDGKAEVVPVRSSSAEFAGQLANAESTTEVACPSQI